MDPQQIQQQVKEFLRSKLVVTNDAEWGVIEARLTKVVQLKMQMKMGGAGLMGGGRFGGNGGGKRRMDQIVREVLGIEPMPEAEALQKAIDYHASKADLKQALAKYVEARKRSKRSWKRRKPTSAK